MMRIVFWNCGGTGNLGDDLCNLGAQIFAKNLFGPHVARQFFKITIQNLDYFKTADLIIIGGGQLLDKTDFIEQIIKHDIRTKFAFVGVGAGDINDVRPFQQTLEPIFWGVRDNHSFNLLREAGFKCVFNQGDITKLVEFPEIKLIHGHKIIGLNFKNIYKGEEWKKHIVDLLDDLEEPVTLFAFNSWERKEIDYYGEKTWISDGDSASFAEDIKRRSLKENQIHVLSYNCEADDGVIFGASLQACKYMVVERLHAAILCHRFKIPFYAIGYHDKVSRFMKENEMEENLIGMDPEEIFIAIKKLQSEEKANA